MKTAPTADGRATETEPQTALITGATTGIGAEAAVGLADRGWRVFVHGRNRERGENVVARVRTVGGEATFLQADFASREAVGELASAVDRRTDRLDALVLNAGLSRSVCQEVWDGVEEVFAVNQLAPYLLTHELADTLRGSAPARVIVTSSTTHSRGELNVDPGDLDCTDDFDAFASYARSKLANLCFSVELAERFADANVTVNAFHPGFVPGSEFYRDVGVLFRAGIVIADLLPFVGTSVDEGAAAIVHLVDDESVADTTGAYFDGTRRTEPDPRVFDPELRAHLWDVCAEFADLDPEWP